MFEDLFTKPSAITSYRAAPLLEERLSYLSHCAQAGARPATLRSGPQNSDRVVRWYLR